MSWNVWDIGFYSVIAYDDRKFGATIKDPKRQRLLVRARAEEDMKALRDHYLPNLKYWRDGSADYEWRALVTRTEWAGACAAYAMDIDYTNFKSSIQDHERHTIYMSVWSTLNRIGSKFSGWGGSGYKPMSTPTKPSAPLSSPPSGTGYPWDRPSGTASGNPLAGVGAPSTVSTLSIDDLINDEFESALEEALQSGPVGFDSDAERGCMLCPKVAKSGAGLQSHMRAKHPNVVLGRTTASSTTQ